MSELKNMPYVTVEQVVRFRDKALKLESELTGAKSDRGRLVEALRDMLDDATDNGYESICTEKARALLSALEAEKGGEL